MKTTTRILLLTLLPMTAFAWAPYESSVMTPSEQPSEQAQAVAAYDPATIPLDYYDANESEDSTPNTDGPLDAD